MPPADTAADPWPIAFAAALAGLAVFLFAPQVLNDGDTYWHLATGQWILAHRQIPSSDVFSFTRAGAPWLTIEWLSEALMALAYRAAGWSGLVILFGAAAAATAGLLAGRLARSLGGIGLILTLVLALASTSGSLLARPHMLALPIIVLWLSELLSARARGRAPRLWFAGLMTLWANLHGGYVFGFVLLAPFALEALVEAAPADRFKVIRDWGLFGLLSVLAILITPHGLEGLVFPFKVMTMTILPGIVEWRPADFSHPGLFEMALLAGLFVCLSRGVKVGAIRTLLLLFLLHMALQHARHLMILTLAAPLILAEPLAIALGQPAKTRRAPKPWLLGAFAAVTILLCGVRLALPLTRVDNATTPLTALDHVPAALRARPVLNDYGFGGYLVFKGVKPFIDGRADMYGDAFVERYFQMTRPDPALLDEDLRRYDIAWSILQPSDPTAAALDARPGWKRLYADRFAVVHVRTDAP